MRQVEGGLQQVGAGFKGGGELPQQVERGQGLGPAALNVELEYLAVALAFEEQVAQYRIFLKGRARLLHDALVLLMVELQITLQLLQTGLEPCLLRS